jgi:hypothetical protein
MLAQIPPARATARIRGTGWRWWALSGDLYPNDESVRVGHNPAALGPSSQKERIELIELCGA